MPFSLKNKMVILHATTTTKVKIDHTKRALLTHMPPPQVMQKDAEFLGGGESILYTPLPRGYGMQVNAVKFLLLQGCKMNKHTKKKDKYD